MGKEMSQGYTLEEIVGMIKSKAEQQPAFFGETTILWQDGKMVLWKENNVTRKPMGTTRGRGFLCGQRL